MTSSRRALRSTPPRPPSAPPGRRGSSSSPSRERPADRRLQVGRDLFDPFLDRSGDIHVRDAASGEVVDLLPLESARQLSLELTGPVLDPAELVATEHPDVVGDRAVDELVQAHVGAAVPPE